MWDLVGNPKDRFSHNEAQLLQKLLVVRSLESTINSAEHKHGVQRRMISVDNFFVFLRLLFFCFIVAICDLVHDVETIFHISCVLTASGNLF